MAWLAAETTVVTLTEVGPPRRSAVIPRTTRRRDLDDGTADFADEAVPVLWSTACPSRLRRIAARQAFPDDGTSCGGLRDAPPLAW
jgi:hypothetical protein